MKCQNEKCDVSNRPEKGCRRLPKNIRVIQTAAQATDCLSADWPMRHANAYGLARLHRLF
ncbi:DUF982 domain-containing protein [Rhizobium calliandrae]|uniref:DUF982 domain-containing protein n=1 Tax=Rhizobium calliandrae TaxID=1312182 RepID=UPI003D80A9A6